MQDREAGSTPRQRHRQRVDRPVCAGFGSKPDQSRSAPAQDCRAADNCTVWRKTAAKLGAGAAGAAEKAGAR